MNLSFLSLALFALGVSISPLIAYWAFSNIVSTMPSTDKVREAFKLGAGGALVYEWIFNLAHIAAGNAARVFPQLRALESKPPNGGQP